MSTPVKSADDWGRNDAFFLELIDTGVLYITTCGRVKNMQTGNYLRDKPTGDYKCIEWRDPATGRRRYISKHRLVCLAVHGPIPARFSVNHEDGDKDNDHPNNLKAGPHCDNIKHSYMNRLQPKIPTGEGH